MSALRRWFGPSREEVWRELSSQIGASYVDGGFWKGDKVQARHGEWTITLDTYTVHANNTHIPFTRLRAPYVNPGGFRFVIYQRSVFSGLGTFFGMQDVEVGHEAFDRDFVIKGTSDAQLRELFSSARLRELLEQQPDRQARGQRRRGLVRPQLPGRRRRAALYGPRRRQGPRPAEGDVRAVRGDARPALPHRRRVRHRARSAAVRRAADVV